MKRATIVTVGSELTNGLRIDTNTAEIARALTVRGFDVVGAISVADDASILGEVIRSALAHSELVITTGGLGPTHDDITREAAKRALGAELVVDPRIIELLRPLMPRHANPVAAEQMLVQAQVIVGSRVIDFTTGTAPGQVITGERSTLVILPGPPSEMRPMLSDALSPWPPVRAAHREIGVVGMSESDVQIVAQEALRGRDGVGFTILAKPGDVRVLLMDDGCGLKMLTEASEAVADRVGEAVYTREGRLLAEVVIGEASKMKRTIAVAESCTGGMVCGSLTSVPGASEVFRGGVVAYDNQVKVSALGVAEQLIGEFGAVSPECARAMARGAAIGLGADLAVAVTGVAGPGGGTDDKPVGTVWFAVWNHDTVEVHQRLFGSSTREGVRARATSTALDLLRRAVRRR
jgi:nicotinamide-nucleotide amidase